MTSHWHHLLEFTYEVPDEDVLVKDAGRLEAVVENLLQRCNQAALPAQQHREAPSLRTQHRAKQ